MVQPHYTFVHATAAHLPVMQRLAAEARLIMRRSGNMHQWVDGYPQDEVLLDDIARGGSYLVLAGDEVVGTFAFLPGPDPTYAVIAGGRWLDVEQPYCVLHRIATTAASRGVLRAIVDFCFTRTQSLRIDTHRDNVIMRHLLAKLGFTRCGIIYLASGAERLAYQKLHPCR